MNNRDTIAHRYSREELEEFRQIILSKLSAAREEYMDLQKAISDDRDNSSESGAIKVDYSSEVGERESLGEFATRQAKFIQNLESALERIEQGTYGICKVTGRLIEKERLRAVPHTNHSLEAKQRRV